jgi:hypothetical protein
MPTESKKEEEEKTDIGYFKSERPDQYKYVIKELLPCTDRIVVIHAPVKSGKRHIVEIYSSLTNGYSINMFISTWNRKSDSEQHTRLKHEDFNMKVHTFSTKKGLDTCIKDINTSLKSVKNSDTKIILHIDEMDFGAGNKMLLSKVFETYKYNDRVRFFLYSATCEIVKSEINDYTKSYKYAEFVPSSKYYGIKNYIVDGRFFEADDFVDFINGSAVLSDHADELLNDLVEQAKDTSHHRHIGVVRLAGRVPNTKNDQVFDYFKELENYIVEKYHIECTFISHKDERNAKWNNIAHWKNEIILGKTRYPKLYILNQMAGRSTQWKCHPFLCWYHCKRGKDTPIGTIIQDQERPVYYMNEYNKNNNIKIYGNELIARYSAGLLSLQDCTMETKKHINTNCRMKGVTKTNVVNIMSKDFNTLKEVVDFCIENKIGNINQDNNAHKKHFRIHEHHINDKYRLKEHMEYRGKTYKINNWDKYKQYENFYMSNIRGSRGLFIKGKCDKLPIYTKENIEQNKDSINERNKCRLNIVYKEGETDPNKYRFCLRYFDSVEEKDIVSYNNKTMYK